MFPPHPILINKPHGWSSYEVIRQLKKVMPGVKIGHAGTLDPLATGLLIICTGINTKLISQFQGLEKEYTGTFLLGATTPSYDAETAISEQFDISHINHEKIKLAALQFTGELQQMPPAHSAKKIGGKRAYHKARRGQDVQLSPASVTVTRFEITAVELPVVSFIVICSKGTYIRSLVHDMGKALGAGAYLTSLCRTRIGNFLLQNSFGVDDILAKIKEQHPQIESESPDNQLSPAL